MLIYAGLKNYDNDSLEHILLDARINGLVLGDGFCNKKMFPHGEYDLLRYIERVLARRKILLYQTPCFLTDYQMDKQLQILDYLKTYKNQDIWILVQDFGIADVIKTEYPGFKMCWSRLGKFRVDILNTEFLKVLREMGISHLETDRADRIDKISQLLTPVYIYGKVSYRSFGRICYNCYETDKKVYECGRECLKEEYTLQDKQFFNEISLDGYVLGENYSLSIRKYIKEDSTLNKVSEDNSLIGIYGKDIKDLNEKIESWKEMLAL